MSLLQHFPSSSSITSEEAKDDPRTVVVATHKLPLVARVGHDMNLTFVLKEDDYVYQLTKVMSETHKVFVIGLLNIVISFDMQEKDIEVSIDMQDDIANKLLDRYNFLPIFLPKDGDDCTDENFLSNYLWPLLNGVCPCLSNDGFSNGWNRYISRHHKYVVKVCHLLNLGKAIVWIEDYTLMLLPRMIRRMHPKTQIVFLLRNPIPSLEMFQIMTTMKELLIGLLGSDLIAFSSSSHSYHFLYSCWKFFDLKYKSNSGLMELEYDGRLIGIKVVPVMIHLADLSRFLNEPTNEEWLNELKTSIGGRQVVLAIDNLSECCGIELKFHAMDEILSQGVFVVLIQLIVLPMDATNDMHEHVRKIQALRDRINARYGNKNGPVIVSIYRGEVKQKERTRYYKLADCLVITAIQDIVYYTPFEFIVCGKCNIVISNIVISPFSLSSVIQINPWDSKEVKEAIISSLARPKNMISYLRDLAVVEGQTMKAIFSDILIEVKHQSCSYEGKEIHYVGQAIKGRQIFIHHDHTRRLDVKELKSTYDATKKRLIVIDCDEKLNPINEGMLNSNFTVVLNELCSDIKNTVVLFTKLADDELPNWFNSCMSAKCVLEDGLLIRDMELNEDFKLGGDEFLNWKKSVGNILENLKRKTAGTCFWENNSSFVWRLDCFEPHLSDLVVEELESLWRGDGFTVIKRDQNCLSIKYKNVTKGAAAKKLLVGKKNDDDECPPDFVLFVGLDGVDRQLVDAVQRAVSFSDKEVKICKIRVGLLPPSDSEYVYDAKELVEALTQITSVEF